MKKYLLLLLTTIATSCCKSGKSLPDTTPDPEPRLVESLSVVNIRQVAREIGFSLPGETLPNPNSTQKRFGMSSTDFGNMWDAGNGKIFAIFGDNFNDVGGDWLSNAIAVSNDRNLSDGMYYDSMLWDVSKGKRKEIIKADVSREITCIPTGGFSVKSSEGVRQYVNYMSVRQWATGGNDRWSCHYSEIVYSDDYGQSWTRSGVKWDGGSNFVQVAYVVRDDIVYMWGTPSGRYGNVFVAKVNVNDVLMKDKYLYWDGGKWNNNESAAAPIANGVVSEMTVRYNTCFNRYMMMYLSAKERKLVFRDAAFPEGEWSEEKIVLNGTYGPSIHPWFCDGKDLWFVSSDVTSNENKNYNTWHIFLYHADLKADDLGFNMVWEPGFEYDSDESISSKTLWNIENALSSHDAHSGNISCRLSNKESGVWKDACTQTVMVKKNTDYILSGWAKSSFNETSGSYLGVRLPDGKIEDLNPPLKDDEWTKIEVKFNSANNSKVEVFFGTWGQPGLTVYVDDITMKPLSEAN